MIPQHYLSPDLHEENLDSLLPTSLNVKTQLVNIYYLYETKKKYKHKEEYVHLLSLSLKTQFLWK